MPRFIDAKLFKFLIVGVINTIVGAGTMFLLYNVFECSYWISSACNYIVGGICSFLLNKYFTFKNHKKSFVQIIQFSVLLVICYLIAYIGAKQLVYALLADFSIKIRDNIAMFTGMCLYTLLNYIGQRFFVFKEENVNG
ncbi:GtrA family protein [Treponema sp.]|uniref:GtrA family protein n=1 Tax=Treponema sp. TaxID=166 RepID=UPI00388F8AA0